ncbi:MAG: 23S rRNA (uracil(1939)-C(5))-methyltransferase, partial [Burkholderiales bacterium]
MGFLAGPLAAPSPITNDTAQLPEGVIESLDGEGRGVARGVGSNEGKAIFIEGALPGERVTYRSYLVKPNYELARVEQVYRESSARVKPACEFFGNCGGCAMQHVEFRTQVAVKQRVLEDAFERIGKVEPESLLRPIYGTPWGYRHRARLSVRYVRKKGIALVGFREK